jgi:hypothetical protein
VFNFLTKLKTTYLFISNTFPACFTTHKDTLGTHSSSFSANYTQTPLTSTFFKEVYNKIIFTSTLTSTDFTSFTYRKISLVWLLYRFAVKAKMRVIYYANN